MYRKHGLSGVNAMVAPGYVEPLHSSARPVYSAECVIDGVIEAILSSAAVLVRGTAHARPRRDKGTRMTGNMLW